MQEQQVIRAVAHWVDSVVVQLNLCPFARKELDRHKDDLETKKVLERESRKLAKRTPLGAFNTVLLIIA